jgi:hypothetical protein
MGFPQGNPPCAYARAQRRFATTRKAKSAARNRKANGLAVLALPGYQTNERTMTDDQAAATRFAVNQDRQQAGRGYVPDLP